MGAQPGGQVGVNRAWDGTSGGGNHMWESRRVSKHMGPGIFSYSRELKSIRIADAHQV